MFSYFCPLHYTKFNLLIVMHIYHRTIFTLPYFISCLHYAAYIIASYTHNSAFLLSMSILSQFCFYYYWPNNSCIWVMSAIFICGMSTTFHVWHVCCIYFLICPLSFHVRHVTLILILACLVSILFLLFKFRSWHYLKLGLSTMQACWVPIIITYAYATCWFIHST